LGVHNYWCVCLCRVVVAVLGVCVYKYMYVCLGVHNYWCVCLRRVDVAALGICIYIYIKHTYEHSYTVKCIYTCIHMLCAMECLRLVGSFKR